MYKIRSRSPQDKTDSFMRLSINKAFQRYYLRQQKQPAADSQKQARTGHCAIAQAPPSDTGYMIIWNGAPKLLLMAQPLYFSPVHDSGHKQDRKYFRLWTNLMYTPRASFARLLLQICLFILSLYSRSASYPPLPLRKSFQSPLIRVNSHLKFSSVWTGRGRSVGRSSIFILLTLISYTPLSLR